MPAPFSFKPPSAMETPEPVYNAREQFGTVDFDVHPNLSEAAIKPEFGGRFKYVDADQFYAVSGLDYSGGEWTVTLHVEVENAMGSKYKWFTYPVRAVSEWRYGTEALSKTREAVEKLEAAQSLLDDVWGNTGGQLNSKNATRTVAETVDKLKRELETWTTE